MIIILDVKDDSIFLTIHAFVGDKVGCRENLWCFLEVSLFFLASEGFHSTSHVGFLGAFYLASWSHRVN